MARKRRRRNDRPEPASLEQLLSEARDYLTRLQRLHEQGVGLQQRLIDLEGSGASPEALAHARRQVERAADAELSAAAALEAQIRGLQACVDHFTARAHALMADWLAFSAVYVQPAPEPATAPAASPFSAN